MNQERLGVVDTFDRHVGLGWIEADHEAQRWMFHCTTIADGSRVIEVGQRVRFLVGAGGPGRWEAFDIEPDGS